MLFFFCFCSCDFLLNGDPVIIQKEEKNNLPELEINEPELTEPELTEIDGNYISGNKTKERDWTILVYMAADNSLEATAISDINEMEKSSIDTDEITLLALVDRSPGFDTSNTNWDKTRLLKIKTGKKADDESIWSDELDCETLGVNREKETELDTSSYVTLGKSIDFIFNSYPANHYGLIIWGSGEGWRGFCYDGTSGTQMNLYQLEKGLNNGLNGNKLDFIGFDSCFGAELEVMYQIKDYCEYSVGVEGLLGVNGWNYEAILNNFGSIDERSGYDFCDAVINQFSIDYETKKNASISCVKLSEMKKLFQTFDDFCLKAGELINSTKMRDLVKDTVTGKTVQFVYEEENNDLQMDIYSLVENLSLTFSENSEIEELKNGFIDAQKEAVLRNWNSEGYSTSLGVYFSTLTVGNLFSARHPAAYTKNKTANQIDFVQDSLGYVPGADDSLLEKIFYTTWE